MDEKVDKILKANILKSNKVVCFPQNSFSSCFFKELKNQPLYFTKLKGSKTCVIRPLLYFKPIVKIYADVRMILDLVN